MNLCHSLSLKAFFFFGKLWVRRWVDPDKREKEDTSSASLASWGVLSKPAVAQSHVRLLTILIKRCRWWWWWHWMMGEKLDKQTGGYITSDHSPHLLNPNSSAWLITTITRSSALVLSSNHCLAFQKKKSLLSQKLLSSAQKIHPSLLASRADLQISIPTFSTRRC